ncbi:alpha/beta hydrolase-fold protein [Ichthyenterobacterium magnum]|uniref:Putative esterase n=1 Tax=Ichthyenterobacterium magnum TaxID=1230530 RepID=A0A420DMF0_9FLAO|nr:alpha/beta hydrolase-fold protein [Ichthyenterobacterium magnum]RKE95375.1 putative esterase [Ichthyenterobacterium magnum]
MKLFIIALIYCFLSANTFAQQGSSEISIGTNHTIHSKILNQDRELQVYLPDNYKDSGKLYPVLYILDGQWYFLNGIAIQKSTRSSHYFPDMIVVGIKTTNPLRRSLYGRNSENFLLFLEKEVIKYVDDNFKTTNTRILFGWENAANFASSVILHEKQIFDAVIVSNGAFASNEEIDAFDALENSTIKYLYIAGSTKDIYSIGYSEAFSNALQEKNPKNLMYKSELFNDETHGSLSYLAMHFGLKHYYHNYLPLNFSSIKDYENKGGIEYLTNYFKERGNRFGLSTEIDDSVKNTLIWLAWSSDNFNSFKYFMTQFSEVLSTRRYASGYWQNRIGQFYLKHKDYDSAIKHFKHGIATFPDARQLKDMYSGLGDAYMAKGDIRKGKQMHRKVKSIQN